MDTGVDQPGPSETDIAMMRLAISLADRAAAEGEVPVGAVVYNTRAGEILAQAHNTREMHNNPAGHAEFGAIMAACEKIGDWRLNHCSLAVTLEPCPMCAGLIVNARIGRLVYGASDPKAGAVRTLFSLCDDPRLNHRCQIVPGVMEEECRAQLSGFFSILRARRRENRGSDGKNG